MYREIQIVCAALSARSFNGSSDRAELFFFFGAGTQQAGNPVWTASDNHARGTRAKEAARVADVQWRERKYDRSRIAPSRNGVRDGR